MKRLVITSSVAALSVFFLASAAGAQGGEAGGSASLDSGDLFAWAQETPPDWGAGILFATLGLVGAVLTVFAFVGGNIPGTAGKSKIDAETARLDSLDARLDVLIKADPPDTAAIHEVRLALDSLHKALTAERWRQYAIAAILYSFLGAFFASALAKDLLQAFAIGVGWTSVIGTFGLKRDFAERKSIKDESISKLQETIDGLGSVVADLQARLVQAELTQPTTMPPAARFGLTPDWTMPLDFGSNWGTAAPNIAKVL